MPGTLNVYSNAGDVWAGPIQAPNYADLGIGLAYCVVVFNTTDTDITSGDITFAGADALPDNMCRPGDFEPLDPVQDCGPIVTGVPAQGPVKVTVTPDRPIRAHSQCQYSIPCPKQFLQVTAAPGGTFVCCVITRLRRTNFDHLGPMGFIPEPLIAPPPPTTPPAGAPPEPARRRRAEAGAAAD